MRTEYNYESLFLKPRKTIVNSRSECSTKVYIGKHEFNMPIIPANMKSVVDENTCRAFNDRGYFYIMHRFNVDNSKFIIDMHKESRFASISVGVNEDSYDQLNEIKKKEHPEFITLDIAHCWCPKGERMIKFIKDNFPNTFLIAGNVAASEAVSDLEEWGADCVKIFVGPGKVCLTKLNTGFTRGTVNCLQECSQVANKPLIADGGIREPGDIAKALALGAHMVMAGSIFSGFEESPGELIEIDGNKFKEYYGSSTEYSKGKNEHIEGKKILVPYKGDIKYYLNHIEESLRSSISYAGGKDLSCLPLCDYFILES